MRGASGGVSRYAKPRRVGQRAGVKSLGAELWISRKPLAALRKKLDLLSGWAVSSRAGP